MKCYHQWARSSHSPDYNVPDVLDYSDTQWDVIYTIVWCLQLPLFTETTHNTAQLLWVLSDQTNLRYQWPETLHWCAKYEAALDIAPLCFLGRNSWARNPWLGSVISPSSRAELTVDSGDRFRAENIVPHAVELNRSVKLYICVAIVRLVVVRGGPWS